MDLRTEIRRTVDTGKVKFGTKSAEKELLVGKAKAIILSTNLPDQKKEMLENYAKMTSIDIIPFEGSSLELGSICGKPFNIGVLTVLDSGKSKLLQASEN